MREKIDRSKEREDKGEGGMDSEKLTGGEKERKNSIGRRIKRGRKGEMERNGLEERNRHPNELDY